MDKKILKKSNTQVLECKKGNHQQKKNEREKQTKTKKRLDYFMKCQSNMYVYMIYASGCGSVGCSVDFLWLVWLHLTI